MRYLLSTRLYIILAFLIIILMRIPALLMWSPSITGSDSSMYMETARNVAEGKGFVSSVCRFHMDKRALGEYISEYGNRYVGTSRAPVYISMLSLVYLLTGKAGFMTGTIILNLLLLLISLYLIYLFLKQKYPDNKLAHILALLWIGGSFTLFEFSFGAWLESFTLFNFIVVLVLHFRMLEGSKSKWWQYLVYGFALASLFTIKRSNMPIAAAFILHLMLQRDYKRFLIVSLYTGLFAGAWYYIRYYVMDMPPLYPFSHEFPYIGYSREVSAIPRFFLSGKAMVNVLVKYFKAAMSMQNLGLLFPFAILYLAGEKRSKEKSLVWCILLMNLGVYIFTQANPSPRYIFPVFAILIIYAAVYMDKTIKSLFTGNTFIPSYIVIMFTLFYQIAYVSEFTMKVPLSGSDREQAFKAADALLDKYMVPEDAMLMFNMRGYNVYSDRGFVLAPPNTEHDNYQEVIDLYDIDYILQCNGLTDYFFWFERTIGIEKYRGLPLLEEVYLDNLMSIELYDAKPDSGSVMRSAAHGRISFPSGEITVKHGTISKVSAVADVDLLGE